jgi:hypothetical protein
MWNMQMSPADYRETLAGLTELELWFAREKGAKDGSDLTTSVNTWTDLYPFSMFYSKKIAARDNSEWNTVLKQMTGYEVSPFMEHFAPRMEEDLRKAQEDMRLSLAGFMHEYHHEYFKGADTGDLLTLHFRNFFAPDSPANHADELKAGLRTLIAKAQGERPDVEKVQCASWLNNVPFFLELFPEEWRANAVTCPYEPSAGWWGQMIDRKGKLHEGNAAHLREQGQFKHANVHGRCPVDRLVQHLSR